MKEIRDIITQLLDHLPDNNAHAVGTADDETWYWCWQELSATAQTEVKAVRKAANSLLNKLYAAEEEKTYIVRSGDGLFGSSGGHFVRFDNGSPLMNTDPVCATRMKIERAKEVIKQLGKLGFAGELIELRFGRIKESEVPKYYCKQCRELIRGENAYSTYGTNGVFCSLHCTDKHSNKLLRRLGFFFGKLWGG